MFEMFPKPLRRHEPAKPTPRQSGAKTEPLILGDVPRLPKALRLLGIRKQED